MSQDERRILTASADGVVRVWYMYLADLIEKGACPRLPRTMTLEEWNRFMEGDYHPICLEASIPLMLSKRW